MIDLIQHTRKSIDMAIQGQSKLTDLDLSLPGMSGAIARMFLNNICSISGIRYLEIGLWKGSTFCSAIKGNSITAVGIDNWTQFNGPREEFFDVLKKYTENNNVKIIDADCFSIDTSKIGTKFNVYFYDGDHTFEAQEKAFTYFDHLLEDTFVAIVDDYKEQDVIAGTESAFNKLGYTTLYERKFHVPHGVEDNVGWWNGMLISVVNKSITKWDEK